MTGKFDRSTKNAKHLNKISGNQQCIGVLFLATPWLESELKLRSVSICVADRREMPFVGGLELGLGQLEDYVMGGIDFSSNPREREYTFLGAQEEWYLPNRSFHGNTGIVVVNQIG